MKRMMICAVTALGAITLLTPVSTAASQAGIIANAPMIREKAPSTTATTSSYGWTSSNWSGYALAGGTNSYHDITGSWTVPIVKASKHSAYSSTWIGIDGYNNSDLIQTGTEQDYTNGSAHYNAWWEILPAAETPLSTSSYPVSPGDHMSASIHNNGNGTWNISISDTTKNWTFNITKSYSGPGSSAEWIQEAPTVGGRIATLANYGQVTIDPGTVNGANPSFTPSESGAMVQKHTLVSVPSNPDSDTDGFNAAYGSVQPGAPNS